jgi:filamentous hemagglutinin
VEAIEAAWQADLNAHRFNRQLHPDEKVLARRILEDAKSRGIVNPDGSPVSLTQIENAMRGANNSRYGEIAATGVVVPLNANTPASAVYDTTGMKLVTDNSGNYLVQDPSMLATPSQALQSLIVQNTGGANSPYSWNPPSTTQATTTPNVDKNGPFSPGWNTGDNSAGFVREHSPTTAIGINVSTGIGYTWQGGFAVNPGQNGSLPTFAAYSSSGGTVGSDFGPALSFTQVKGNAGANFAGQSTSVNAGAAVVRGSVEGGAIYDGNNNLVGGSVSVGLKSPLPVYVGPIGSVTQTNTRLFGVVDGKFSWGK